YRQRVRQTERLAILAAIVCGMVVTLAFLLAPSTLVYLFLDAGLPAAEIAVKGFPLFATAFVAFIFNLTAIGYFQSVEKAGPSILFALLRGVIFLVPAFILLPEIWGESGIWLALGVSELLTSLAIIIYYLRKKSAGASH
ncbi:MAG: MATE family efflux transporter, partial [Paramuribaculum sp.]|nr:MATE family efflux transporter [Paramuribaculum sp.]